MHPAFYFELSTRQKITNRDYVEAVVSHSLPTPIGYGLSALSAMGLA